MSTRPSGTDRAPNFVVFVQSSLRVIATAMTAPDVIRISGPEIENLGSSGLSKASVAPRTICAKIRAGPSCLQKEIVRPAERQQPALDGVLRVFGAL